MRGTFRQFEIFLTVAGKGSFSAAADALDIAQASVSKQVAALECALDERLFRRSIGQPVALTARGERLLEELPGLMEHAARVAAPTAASPVVRVGADAMILERYFYPHLAAFTVDFPGTVLEFSEIASEAEALHRQDDTQVDLMYFTFREPLESAFGAPLKIVESSIFGAPAYNAVQKKGQSQIEECPVILPMEGSADEAIHTAALGALGVSAYRVVARSQRMSNRLDMTAAGIGLCIAPVHFTQPYLNAGRLVRIVDRITHSYRYGLIVSKRRDKYMSCARKYLTSLLR
ncbi:LysR family transcriptional regulator [Novosphingobium sp. AP12]|uniref:LysR family transcriptional regulator n=1 Tax=Novosphingobium sp. AP12 TaxID=1144305 RepID=UPI000271E315|nr:LysR family transcriptional regulator [Novosphingobium sp. AP12]EJL20236.1 transcriptional regulator [Novosphingobium sp. AP12]